jgi:hypothetical protein
MIVSRSPVRLRALLVLGALLGVLVLHGLAAHRDAMIVSDVDTARTAVAVAAQQALYDAAVVGDAAADRALVEAPLAPHDDHQLVPSDAFLTALLLLLGLAVLRFGVRPIDDGTARSPRFQGGALSSKRPPDLAELCILRT